jgi:hypothetical protein
MKNSAPVQPRLELITALISATFAMQTALGQMPGGFDILDGNEPGAPSPSGIIAVDFWVDERPGRSIYGHGNPRGSNERRRVPLRRL